MLACNPDSNILAPIRARFIERGSTLTQWCRANGIDPARAHRVLKGNNLGPKGRALRNKIAGAAQAGIAQ